MPSSKQSTPGSGYDASSESSYKNPNPGRVYTQHKDRMDKNPGPTPHKNAEQAKGIVGRLTAVTVEKEKLRNSRSGGGS
ncbi:uncharacterized protein N0V89_004771 [Didymosphaeria variabile]|uniref:Uncharacterized protein n=1 Tax=Didymosphaeria variabile TaxID=1932322 RepID=A0A9W8XT48_9PLEO|nr:uncharacterized protein N0V89_004771 [Didymosphaeria variabile]KAJ4356735.1 hypothetical protein N0V89_004771 [Didymosphaeria variabile]